MKFIAMPSALWSKLLRALLFFPFFTWHSYIVYLELMAYVTMKTESSTIR